MNAVVLNAGKMLKWQVLLHSEHETLPKHQKKTDMQEALVCTDLHGRRWPHATGWQEPMRPFAVRREVVLPGSTATSEEAGGIAGLTALIRPKPAIPKIFHQVGKIPFP